MSVGLGIAEGKGLAVGGWVWVAVGDGPAELDGVELAAGEGAPELDTADDPQADRKATRMIANGRAVIWTGVRALTGPPCALLDRSAGRWSATPAEYTARVSVGIDLSPVGIA
jgi:hypothetical protein